MFHKCDKKEIRLNRVQNWSPLSFSSRWREWTLAVVVWVCWARAQCPLDCLCGLDERGRRRVSCLAGGMAGTLPTLGFPTNTQFLEVRPPPTNPNWLLIGTGFQALPVLEELHVTHSHVPEIAKHAFWGVKGLRILNLSHNNITVLHDHNFRGLADLRELLLDDNNIEELATGGFRYLTELRALSLARNRLHELEARVFERLGKLHSLSLSGNHLGELYPEVFMDIQELRVFECRSCGLRNINTQIYHLLPHLTSLDLGDNDFFYLTNDEFYELRKLRYLWLDGNHLPVVLEKTFIMQRELQKVSLARNRLAKVTNTAFANVTTLTDLDISFNKLIRIEPAVFLPIAESLQRLDLSGNNLVVSELKYTLQGLGNLKHLGLAKLNLTEMPVSLLIYHEKLRSLNMSENLLETFPTQFPVPNLSELDLSKNKFNGFDERTMLRLDKISKVLLDDNPWICDLCNIIPLLSRVNKSSVVKSVTCTSPKLMKNRILSSIKENEVGKCGADDSYETSNGNFFANTFRSSGHVIIIVVTTIGVLCLLVGSIAIVRVCCFKRRSRNYYEEEDKRAAQSTQEAIFENAAATAIFGQNGEISFKFPLELSEKKKASISTIDDIKKETRLSSLPNGEL